MKLRSLSLVVMAAALLVGACGGDDGGETVVEECTNGAIADCIQDDQAEGQKKCIDGAWTACGPAYCEAGQAAACTTECGTEGQKLCQEDSHWGDCVGVELCNNVDDDCDGDVDEELTQPCACGSEQGVRECVAGEFGVCSAGEPDGLEICDGKDNDCDSLVDEDCDKDHDGFCDEGMTYEETAELCPHGGGDCNDAEKTINPDADEKCNGIDDNCDGDVDEDLGTMVCGGIGECDEVEVDLCQDGALVQECPEETKFVGQSEEVCDDLDNDCDGEVDEDLEGCCEEGEIAVCGTNQGECQKGVKECGPDKSWGECGGEDYIAPMEELCNNLDDDCDGQVDEENPEGGEVCGSDEGECIAGIYTCVDGEVICKDEVPASEEVCNHKDDDCDGVVDNGLAADQNEENDQCSMARDLGELPEGSDPLSTNGTLYKDGAVDTDWYKLLAKEQSDWIPCGWDFSDGCFALIVTLTPPATSNMDLCINAQDCEGTEFSGCEATGGPGESEQMLLTWTGAWAISNDSKTVYTQVLGASESDQDCESYVLTYEFFSECKVDGLCWWEEGYVPPEQ